MDGYVMVIPAEGDQIVGTGGPTLGPGLDVVDFESIPGIVAFHGTATITVEDRLTQLGRDGAGSSSHIQRLSVLGDADQTDLAVTENLFECSGSDPGTGQDSHTGLTTSGCRRPGIHHYHKIDQR
jgi:hypothetical protein